eukprot:474192-Pyramimonas_sp.AAC.1
MSVLGQRLEPRRAEIQVVVALRPDEHAAYLFQLRLLRVGPGHGRLGTGGRWLCLGLARLLDIFMS